MTKQPTTINKEKHKEKEAAGRSQYSKLETGCKASLLIYILKTCLGIGRKCGIKAIAPSEAILCCAFDANTAGSNFKSIAYHHT